MKKIFTILGLCAMFAVTAQPIVLTEINVAHTGNFDDMGPTGTDYPEGWGGVRIAGTGILNQELVPVVTDGSANSGAVYNVGTTGATDRALGSIASGTTVPAFGAVFENATGTAITGLQISFVQEQWRTGSNNTVNEIVKFEYSLDSTTGVDGTWTAVPALDMTEILTSTTAAAAVNGNDPANRSTKSATITGLNIPDGTTFWIRWSDADAAGSDALLAVDDGSLTPTGTALSTIDFSGKKMNLLKSTAVSDYIEFAVQGNVKIVNLNGQTVKNADVEKDTKMDVSDLSKGIYLIIADSDGKKVSQKFIKK